MWAPGAVSRVLESPPVTDFPSRVEAERAYLLRFARLQLRDAHAAEDAVQEALAAALAGEGGFDGRSNLRTWLTAILKHKIVDHVRRASREAAAGDAEDLSDLDPLFQPDGHWVERPRDWSEPDRALETREFQAVLEDCLARLPERTARAFMMREHLGLEASEICQELGITPTHYWVLLYRARVALRECLEKHWFSR